MLFNDTNIFSGICIGKVTAKSALKACKVKCKQNKYGGICKLGPIKLACKLLKPRTGKHLNCFDFKYAYIRVVTFVQKSNAALVTYLKEKQTEGNQEQTTIKDNNKLREEQKETQNLFCNANKTS